MGTENEQWATVDLMGHGQTAGRISMENGLLRVDVPNSDGYRHTHTLRTKSMLTTHQL